MKRSQRRVHGLAVDSKGPVLDPSETQTKAERQNERGMTKTSTVPVVDPSSTSRDQGTKWSVDPTPPHVKTPISISRDPFPEEPVLLQDDFYAALD